MTIERRRYEQGIAIKDYGLESQGVCWELCRYWVKGRLAGTWIIGESIWDVDNGKGAFANVQKDHVQRNKFTDANKLIEGLLNETSARRTSGCCTYSGLRSRRDVIDHVLTVKGVYLYLTTGGGKKGHAMAFDTRADPLYFFDPNQGEWVLTGESQKGVREWWDGFWSGTNDSLADVNYKTEFHKGARELVRYDTLK